MNHLGLFAKFWQPGAVKTRLADSVGDGAACRLYQAFLFHLLENLASTGQSRYVVFSPVERQPDFRSSIAPAWQLQPQSSGDLGKRMRTFIESRMTPSPASQSTESAQKVILIGADCPQLTSVEIESAFEQLDRHDVVIGPSTDGGYYLIGMRHRCLPVFSEIRWSTEHVFQETLQRLESIHATCHILSAKTDVDNWESLQTLIRDLIDPPTPEPSTVQPSLLQKIDLILANRNVS